MFGLGASELIIILVIGLLLFGAKRLPDIGRALGQASREFSRSSRAKPESPDKAEGPASGPGQEEAGGLEAEIKDQLLSRLPGVGRINRLKRTLDKAGRVVDSLDKKG